MTPLVEARQLYKTFRLGKQKVHALQKIDLKIYSGEVLGLVGESGCGKSTLAKCLLRLIEPSGGTLAINGEEISSLPVKAFKPYRRHMQMIFQDPYASLDPRMTVFDIVAEGIDIHHLCRGKKRYKRVVELLEKVGLSREVLNRYPHEFSGGQRQRIGIARALAPNPSFIVCDEPISALDLSIQAQVVNLLKELQKEMSLTYLFIAHDLAMVRHISDRVGVLYLGYFVELAPANRFYTDPLHPYTQALLSAVPNPDPRAKKQKRIVLPGEVPSPLDPPQGCVFHTRCPFAMPRCRYERPPLQEVKPDTWVACHLYDEKKPPHPVEHNSTQQGASENKLLKRSSI